MSRGGAEKSCENAGAGGGEKTWAKKSKKWLTNGRRGCIIFLVSSASVLRTEPNSGYGKVWYDVNASKKLTRSAKRAIKNSAGYTSAIQRELQKKKDR